MPREQEQSPTVFACSFTGAVDAIVCSPLMNIYRTKQGGRERRKEGSKQGLLAQPKYLGTPRRPHALSPPKPRRPRRCIFHLLPSRFIREQTAFNPRSNLPLGPSSIGSATRLGSSRVCAGLLRTQAASRITSRLLSRIGRLGRTRLSLDRAKQHHAASSHRPQPSAEPDRPAFLTATWFLGCSSIQPFHQRTRVFAVCLAAFAACRFCSHTPPTASHSIRPPAPTVTTLRTVLVSTTSCTPSRFL